MSAIPAAVMDLLGPAPVHVEPLDPRGQPWRVIADDWTAVLRRFSPERYRPEASLEHIVWLHRFLDRLAPSGFPAPKPLPILNGASIAVVDGAIWEALSYLQGRPLAWSPGIALQSAGAILARFHKASLAVGCPEQRPGALPMEDCYPLSAPQIAEAFQRNLQEIGHQSAARCVLHGDCTAANMLVDDGVEVVALIDFTLAHVGPPESDISFALWVTGRTAQPEIALDPERVRAFVAGYHRVRPLTDWSVIAIPLYLIRRGLQMHVRLERLDARDVIQFERLHWFAKHRQMLEDVIASAIET